MNFEELNAEVFARGFQYLDTDAAGRARVARWVNQSYKAICDKYPWPFLEVDTTGSAPLTIADVRIVFSVLNTVTDTRLGWVDRTGLLNFTQDLSTPGAPSFYYLEGNVLKVYPVNTDSLAVRYIRRPVNLTDTDDPLIPEDYHDLIVDGAVLKGLKDSDSWEIYSVARQAHERDIFDMAAAIFPRTSEPDYIDQTAGDY